MPKTQAGCPRSPDHPGMRQARPGMCERSHLRTGDLHQAERVRRGQFQQPHPGRIRPAVPRTRRCCLERVLVADRASHHGHVPAGSEPRLPPAVGPGRSTLRCESVRSSTWYEAPASDLGSDSGGRPSGWLPHLFLMRHLGTTGSPPPGSGSRRGGASRSGSTRALLDSDQLQRHVLDRCAVGDDGDGSPVAASSAPLAASSSRASST